MVGSVFSVLRFVNFTSLALKQLRETSRYIFSAQRYFAFFHSGWPSHFLTAREETETRMALSRVHTFAEAQRSP